MLSGLRRPARGCATMNRASIRLPRHGGIPTFSRPLTGPPSNPPEGSAGRIPCLISRANVLDEAMGGHRAAVVGRHAGGSAGRRPGPGQVNPAYETVKVAASDKFRAGGRSITLRENRKESP